MVSLELRVEGLGFGFRVDQRTPKPPNLQMPAVRRDSSGSAAVVANSQGRHGSTKTGQSYWMRQKETRRAWGPKLLGFGV